MRVIISSTDLFEQPKNVEGVRTVVIEDDHGNAIFVAQQQNSNLIYAADASDPKFEGIVSSLPLKQRVAVPTVVRALL